MNVPDRSDEEGHPPVRASRNLLLALPARAVHIASQISALILSGNIEDETDRGLVSEAAAFILRPTGKLEEIMNHTTNMGQVLMGYEVSGAELPPPIDALHSYLLAFQCIIIMNVVEAELEQASPDLPNIQGAMTRAIRLGHHSFERVSR